MRLADGTVWPLPVHARRRTTSGPSNRATPAALHDASGRLWGVIEVTSTSSSATRSQEARKVYGTEDAAHPGVAYLLARPRTLVGGPVHVLPLPDGPAVRRATA